MRDLKGAKRLRKQAGLLKDWQQKQPSTALSFYNGRGGGAQPRSRTPLTAHQETIIFNLAPFPVSLTLMYVSGQHAGKRFHSAEGPLETDFVCTCVC